MTLLEPAPRRSVAEALDAFDEFRTLLRDELGTPPGGEIFALHQGCGVRLTVRLAAARQGLLSAAPALRSSGRAIGS